jgi:predicted RNase H-like HicB family nuclease
MFTSAKSRSSARPGKTPDKAHVARARELARRYQITVWLEDGHWYGKCVEMPHCLGDGRTADAAIAATRQTVVAGLAADLADGMPAPMPASGRSRREQVNIRLSADERSAIEANAARLGFKGMADYIRAVAVSGLRAA